MLYFQHIKNTSLMADEILKKLEEENAELKKENEALRLVGDTTGEELPAERLSDEARTFTVKKKDKQGKDKKVTAVVADVTAIRLPNKKVKIAAFMKDEKLQQEAIDIDHTLITIK